MIASLLPVAATNLWSAVVCHPFMVSCDTVMAAVTLVSAEKIPHLCPNNVDAASRSILASVINRCVLLLSDCRRETATEWGLVRQCAIGQNLTKLAIAYKTVSPTSILRRQSSRGIINDDRVRLLGAVTSTNL